MEKVLRAQDRRDIAPSSARRSCPRWPVPPPRELLHLRKRALQLVHGRVYRAFGRCQIRVLCSRGVNGCRSRSSTSRSASAASTACDLLVHRSRAVRPLLLSLSASHARSPLICCSISLYQGLITLATTAAVSYSFSSSFSCRPLFSFRSCELLSAVRSAVIWHRGQLFRRLSAALRRSLPCLLPDLAACRLAAAPDAAGYLAIRLAATAADRR